MTGARTDIRSRSTVRDVPTAQALRDAQEALDTIPEQRITVVENVYTEPLALRLDARPVAILAVRVVNPLAPSTPIDHGTAVEWDWFNGRVRINRIAGLVVGTRYRMTLQVLG